MRTVFNSQTGQVEYISDELGEVTGPASAVDSNFASFDGTTGKIIKDSGKKIADFQPAGSYEVITNKATNFSTINDTLYPSVKAVNDAITTAVIGLLDYRGTYDASVNTFPATGGSGLLGVLLKGDFWVCSVSGTLGGVAITPGSLIIALADTPGQTAGNWDLVEYDFGFTPENVTNKVTLISGASTDTQYPSAKLLYDQLTLKENAGIDLRLDQTTPQTVINGTPVFNVGIQTNAFNMPTNAEAGFVLLSDGSGNGNWELPPSIGNLSYYFLDTASDISGDKQQVTTPGAVEHSITTGSLSSDTTLIKTFATNAGFPNLNFLPAGRFVLHIHALASSASKVQIYAEVHEVSSDGSTDYGTIGTTASTPQLTVSNAQYVVDFTLPNVWKMNSVNSRIITKVYAYCTNHSPSPTATIYYGNTTSDSHTELPSNIVDATNFVPYSGATTDVNLSTHNLSTNQITSTVAIGTAPLVVTSTTPVANLSIGGNAGTVTGLSVTAGKTLSVSNSFTLTATDGSTLAIGGGGTLGSNAYTSTAYLPTASFTDSAVTGKLITGFTSGAGTVAATDTILQAINKLDGNVAGKLATGGIAADSSKLGGYLPAAYALVGQTMNIGTTAVAINRASGTLALTGITSIDGSSASCTGNAVTATTATNALSLGGALANTYAPLNSPSLVTPHIDTATVDRILFPTQTTASYGLNMGNAEAACDIFRSGVNTIQIGSVADNYFSTNQGTNKYYRDASTKAIFQSFVSTSGVIDTQPMYNVNLAGKTNWGAGGSTTADCSIARTGVAAMTLTGGLTVTVGFGCNGKTAQTAYASGGAVTPGAGAFGFSSAANAAALATLVTNIRAALVAAGIMS